MKYMLSYIEQYSSLTYTAGHDIGWTTDLLVESVAGSTVSDVCFEACDRLLSAVYS